MLALSPRIKVSQCSRGTGAVHTQPRLVVFAENRTWAREHSRLAQGAWRGLWMGAIVPGLGDTGRTVVPDGARNIFTKALSDFHTIQHRVANFVFTGGR